ncbi:MAG: hypothetical protein ACD_40C00092G0006 [uncultured bacterium]|nr:MAG: hypothetical protein ACD_40C00092G0006 [uncultured bacterium]
MNNLVYILGFLTSIVTLLLTIITFGIAIFTPPYSGPFCLDNCFSYPFHDIASRFPRDYFWMFPAMLLSLAILVLFVCIHYTSSREKQVFSHIALLITQIATGLLFVDYFIQLSFIQPSIIKGELEGISLLSQFNPHGLFIILEDCAYLLMSVAFLFVAQVFTQGKLASFVRIIFTISGIATLLAFTIIFVKFGLNREYFFEVIAISINWLTLIVLSPIIAITFSKKQAL